VKRRSHHRTLAIEGRSWHGAVFDLRTGSVLALPAPRSVGSYAVWIKGDDIEVEL